MIHPRLCGCTVCNPRPRITVRGTATACVGVAIALMLIWAVLVVTP